jgi:hypothetical protein
VIEIVRGQIKVEVRKMESVSEVILVHS